MDPEVSRWILRYPGGSVSFPQVPLDHLRSVSQESPPLGEPTFKGRSGKVVCTLKDDKRWNLTNQQKDWMVEKMVEYFFVYACYASFFLLIFFNGSFYSTFEDLKY